MYNMNHLTIAGAVVIIYVAESAILSEANVRAFDSPPSVVEL